MEQCFLETLSFHIGSDLKGSAMCGGRTNICVFGAGFLPFNANSMGKHPPGWMSAGNRLGYGAFKSRKVLLLHFSCSKREECI